MRNPEEFVSLSVEALQSLADPVVEAYFAGLVEQVNSHAGGIWLTAPDHHALVLAYNVGDHGHEIDGAIEQSLEAGEVSKAFKEDRTICDRGLFSHRDMSPEVDRELEQVTAHQIATPFHLFDQRVGVVTVVQTLAGGRHTRTRWGYTDAHIAQVENASQVLSRLLEWAWLRQP